MPLPAWLLAGPRLLGLGEQLAFPGRLYLHQVVCTVLFTLLGRSAVRVCVGAGLTLDVVLNVTWLVLWELLCPLKVPASWTHSQCCTQLFVLFWDCLFSCLVLHVVCR